MPPQPPREPESADVELPLTQPADEWSGDELEQAYLRALTALEAVEQEAAQDSTQATTSEAASDDGPEASAAPMVDDIPPAEVLSAAPASDAPVPEAALSEAPLPEAAGPELPAPSVRGILPRQIIEAVLFVGGAAVTAKKLATLLRGTVDAAQVEAWIEELNVQYAAENRPYELRLGEGGYRLVLRAEYERVRDKVYGLGPKEVRLSQDALEVLAVVAYRQPIDRQQIEDLGKPNAAGTLRQLLRRELIAVERSADDAKDVHYRTTPRFLSLFGLGELDELPQADELTFK